LRMASDLCSVSQEPHDLPSTLFQERYRNQDRPVVIRNATRESAARFRRLTTLDELTRSFGDANVTLSSANAFSYGRTKRPLSQYLSTMREVKWGDDNATGASADQIFYFFGEHGSEIAPLLDEYPLPRFAHEHADNHQEDALLPASLLSVLIPMSSVGAPEVATPPPALSFGAAPDGSGVPFHFHHDGFSEVMHGAKRWLLYPDRPPGFAANATSIHWLRTVYPTLHPSDLPLDCVLVPGDVLYFPRGWWHATVNIGNTVFMSTFL